MNQMDLIISVCTGPCHLAGALGLRTWTLLRFSAEWRWLWGRDDSPWYPTMRLFRQSRRGDWPELIGRVAAALRAEAG
jgi:ADP-heptose:LPS heptosyltransferase